ncbi:MULTISPECIES: SCO3374 family protein [unclassified Streptomyces]|uniref:SCO3374 family protein n=1 Tax=unclassified Streptomyces TaxID=2593676 RepID=UPI00224F7E85|nr:MULTISPECIES: SCO3374 family protein [unclassified Streptomyces]MCX4527326.1 SCO3374 family protein [Streptomyces sp. NBC_01551]MCX4542094.1 SCO3374 family protein [Streptomyces sp. NBC_01565]
MAVNVPPPAPVPPATVPLSRSASEGPREAVGASRAPDRAYALWYGRELGWSLVGGPPGQLDTGTRFDVLELPSDAGGQLLRRPVPTGPVAVMGRRMRFLVAPGSAEELDGLLDWLEWGGVALDLAALGPGGRITAPAPPGHPVHEGSSRGAAVWLRPPEQGCEALLPALSGPGRGAGPGLTSAGPDLVRLVAAAATECHRARLRRRTPLRSAVAGPCAGRPGRILTDQTLTGRALTGQARFS